MPVFHARTAHASHEPLSHTLQRLHAGLAKLAEGALGGDGFEHFEREAHALFVAAEREVLGEALQRLDVDLPYVHIGGCKHHRVLRSSETYTSAVGPVTVRRTLYRAGQARAVVPLELRAGVVAGHWTPLAARQASFLVAHLTPQECEATLRELGNMAPSKSSLDRKPQGLERTLGGAP